MKLTKLDMKSIWMIAAPKTVNKMETISCKWTAVSDIRYWLITHLYSTNSTTDLRVTISKYFCITTILVCTLLRYIFHSLICFFQSWFSLVKAANSGIGNGYADRGMSGNAALCMTHFTFITPFRSLQPCTATVCEHSCSCSSGPDC